ncbi:MAG: hypothetical protein ACKVVP_09045 [Chloroflexota bacterium]
MFGRLYLFPFGARERAQLEAAVDSIAPRYHNFPGCLGVSFFMDEASGVCGTFSRWESQSDAEAATVELRDELSRLVSEITQAGVELRPLFLPVRLSFEIYEPR